MRYVINLLKRKINIGFILIIVFLGLFFPNAAFADAFTLSGNVSDSVGTSIPGVSVSVTESNTNANAGNTTTDSLGNYSLIIIGGTYNVQITPPAGSNFSPAIDSGSITIHN